MKTKLFLSHLYSLDDRGFISRSLADTLSSSTIIKAVPDFSKISDIDEALAINEDEQSDKIDTIIQYLDYDRIEYYSKYKNIVIFHEKHYIRRNRSLASKLSFADEFWVFDEQNLQFLLDCDIVAENIKTIGFPYSHTRLVLPKTIMPTSTVNFFTSTDIFNLENLESLIFNFVLLFHDRNNIRLNIYIKCFKTKDMEYHEHIFKNLLNKVQSSLSLTQHSNIQNLIKISIGNPYEDYDNYIDMHVSNNCYINLDNTIQPDVITAFRLNKYLLSICDIGDILVFHKDNIIETTHCNYRRSLDETNNMTHYINEYNSYPKINDHSIQTLLVSSLKLIKENKKMSYQKINRKGFYDFSVQTNK